MKVDIRKQAIFVLDEIRKNKPAEFFNKVSESERGMRFILLYLREQNSEVYSNTLSEKMNISRARVAVLLNKLKTKGFIDKSTCLNDARVDIIKLTPKGLDEINNMNEHVILMAEKLIKEVGFDEISKFLEISKKINKVLCENSNC